MDDRQHNIAAAHVNTCDWFFSTCEFTQWRDRCDIKLHHGILWIKGKPGAGKSTIMKHSLFHCRKTFSDHAIAAFFFNARGTALEKSPLGMYQSLLYQLCTQLPDLCQRTVTIFTENTMKYKTNKWHIGQLKDILLAEMQQKSTRPTIILVDALDECNEEQVRQVVYFLETLGDLAMKTGRMLNILLSSRHYPSIKMSRNLEIVVEDQMEHSKDIVTYVKTQLRTNDSFIEKGLIQKASGVFMWVVIVVELVNQAYDRGETKAMQKQLSQVPSDLNEVFKLLLRKDGEDNQETILMLQWTIFAKELLEPEELYLGVLAGIDPAQCSDWDPKTDYSAIIKRFITTRSRGLIEIRAGVKPNVQFIHESVNDFLLRDKRLQTLDDALGSNAVGISHQRLAQCCLAYLKTVEIDLSAPTPTWFSNKSFSKYPLLRYASTNILFHAECSQRDNVSQRDFLQLLAEDKELFSKLKHYHDSFQSFSWTKYSKETELLYALVLHNHHELTKIVLSELSPNLRTKGGYYGNVLEAAFIGGYKEIMEMLLVNGADPNSVTRQGESVLYRYSVLGNEHLVELLLEKGAQVDAHGGPIGNALQAACCMGREKVVKLLIDAGADVNYEGGKHETPLKGAIYWGREEVARMLLENGANPNNANGTAGGTLAVARNGVLLSEEKSQALVDLLLEFGAVDEVAQSKTDGEI